MNEYDIMGSIRKGDIYNKLNDVGISHENYSLNPKYKSNPTSIFNKQTYKFEIPPEHNIDGGKFLGSGAENNVYDHGDYVMKYSKGGGTVSYTPHGKVKTSDLDKLIHQYEKVMNIRVFECVVNTAHNKYAYMNPQKISQIPVISSLNPTVKASVAAIKEDKVKNTNSPVKSIEIEVAKFLPKIVKDIFFYFDKMGGAQAYQSGHTKEGRPIYNVVDGVNVFKKTNKTPEQLLEFWKTQNKTKHEDEHYLKQIEKYQQIITECANRELENIFKEIESEFSS